MEQESFTFMQITDPQLGAMCAVRGIEREKAIQIESDRLLQAVTVANEINPDFLVVTGDIGHNNMDTSEVNRVKTIMSRVSKDIPIHWATGNRDISYDGEVTDPDLLEIFRVEFGDDYYSFTHKGVHFTVLSSTVIYNSEKVPGEWEDQLSFLEDDLEAAESSGFPLKIVFSHHPMFLRHPEEGDAATHIPFERRKILMKLFNKYQVSHVFSGHLHRNHIVRSGITEHVSTSAVGLQAGNDKPGYRLISVQGNRVTHQYYNFDDIHDEL